MRSAVHHNKRAKKASVALLVPALLAGATLCLTLVLLSLLRIDLRYGAGSSLIIFASFASSIFIMYMTPHSKAAKPSKFVKSYLLAGIVGYFGYAILAFMPLYYAAGFVMFLISMLMVVTRSEHPPAAGIAFAFVLFRIGVFGIIAVASGALLILFVRYMLNLIVFKFEEVEAEMKE